MEHILRNVLMALQEQPHATMRILSDRKFRAEIARHLKNESVRTFFIKEFERFSFGYRADGTTRIQNKVGTFLSDPILNRLLTAPQHDLHVRQIMDEGKVLLVNLAKGQIGEDSSYTWADCSSLRSRLLRLAAPTYPSMNGVRSLSTSTSFNTCSRPPIPPSA
ncbi:hypothetical protein I6F18_35195 [Bradyrhizobium sp. NBAIM32]|uniref:hypothetical protein n=1 Tax=Bradyrhizobium sp. NBAIM32 TaxID=2793809 RepID=UPI001CD7E708|nr:hypothetical protein [Bradyrhizobium sp. NBAIM32]MCA1545116.1 hypothetical protein [Bradyrhizobium sp. NBAIM32]